MDNLHFAFLAGICGSAASVLGKFSGLPAIENYLILRMLCVFLMVILNGCVWTLFVKALHQSHSCLLATVASASSNFLFSALMGYLIFRETTTLVWWFGIFFITTGLLFIVKGQEEKDNPKVE